jgi:UDP-glucose 4-epimerase
MSNIMITGVAGFIGANLLRRLLAGGHRVVGIDNLSFGRKENLRECLTDHRFRFIRGDVRDLNAVRRAATEAEVIVHLAAYKIPRYSDAYDTLVINTEGTRKVLEAARLQQARIIVASTSDVYGKSDAVPFVEDGPLVIGPPNVRRWAYGISKIYVEQLLFAYHQRFGLDFLAVRLFGGYGPYQHQTWWGGPQSVFIRCALAGTPMPIHGDGSQTRCLTYVDDYTEALARCIEDAAVKNEVLNLGSDQPTTILDLAHLCWRLVRDDAPQVRLIPYRTFGNYEDVPHRIPDLARLRERIGFTPRISLEEGLRRTIAWQRSLAPRPQARASALAPTARPLAPQAIRLHFVAPLLNEAPNLPNLMRGIAAGAEQLGADYEVILVNDGSTDDSPQVIERLAETFPVSQITHPTRLGVGRAFNSAFEHLLDRMTDEDIVITLEADCTSDLSILPDMYVRLAEGNDLVLASCYLPGGEVATTDPLRIFVSHCANTAARLIFNLRELHTLSSFFRMYRASALRALAAAYGRPLLHCSGFECMLELLAMSRGIGLEVAEVPMVLDHSRRQGRSKMNISRTTAGYLSLFARRFVTGRFRDQRLRAAHVVETSGPQAGGPEARRPARNPAAPSGW